MVEELMETEGAAHRKGLATMTDWWAPQFMECDAPDLREKFAAIPKKTYRLRHLLPTEQNETEAH